MTTEEKLTIAIAALKNIADSERPFTREDDYEVQGDEYCDSGNFDDAGALGYSEGLWDCAEIALDALKLME